MEVVEAHPWKRKWKVKDWPPGGKRGDWPKRESSSLLHHSPLWRKSTRSLFFEGGFFFTEELADTSATSPPCSSPHWFLSTLCSFCELTFRWRCDLFFFAALSLPFFSLPFKPISRARQNGTLSDFIIIIQYGVPQGSVLGLFSFSGSYAGYWASSFLSSLGRI